MSMSSGSAQIPLVHSFEDGLSKSLYRRFPDAMAMRYDGIDVSYYEIRPALTHVSTSSTNLFISICDSFLPDFFTIMCRTVG